MDYQGTEGDDVIDQKGLAIPSGIPIFGLGGNDTIRAVDTHMLGGPGNDTLIALGTVATATYWNDPKGVDVDLAAGIGKDGYGGTDTLTNVRNVHGSVFADLLQGSAADEIFHGHGGNDVIDGRGGLDRVQFILTKPEAFSFRWDLATDVLRVTDTNPGDGNDGVLQLKNIEALDFGKNGGVILVNRYLPSAWSYTAKTMFDNDDAGGSPKYAVGDFNGDGQADLAFRYDPSSAFSTTQTGSSPIRIMTADGTGNLNSAPDLAAATSLTLLGEMLPADFDNNRFDDIVVIASGQDPYLNGLPAPNAVYPGEQPYVLLGDAARMQPVSRTGMPSTFGHDGATADINGDGYTDVFVASISGADRAPFLLINDGKGNFTVDRTRLPVSITTAATTVLERFPDGSQKTWADDRFTSTTLFDANGDGSPDLAVMGFDSTASSKVFLNDGSGHYSDQRVWVLPNGPYGPGQLYKTTVSSPVYSKGTINLDTVALDFNNDGRQDLVALSTFNDLGPTTNLFYGGTSLQLLQNTGTGFIDVTASRTDFSADLRNNANSTYHMLKVTDIDADGFADLLVERRADDLVMPSMRILHNDGKGFFKEMALPPGLDNGLLIPLDPAEGRYANLRSYITGSSGKTGLFDVAVTGLVYDFAQGRNFFTGAMLTQTANLIADLPGRWLHGTGDSNTLTLSSGNERGWGYGGNDVLQGLGGDDWLDGGEGLDFAVYASSRAASTVARSGGKLTVASALDGRDKLTNIERLQFADSWLALDIDKDGRAGQGNAGIAVKAINTLLGKTAVNDKAIVGTVIKLLDAGMSYDALLQIGVAHPLFSQLAGAAGGRVSANQFVDLVYRNVMGVLPDEATSAVFESYLNSGKFTQAQLAYLASDSSHNAVSVDLTGLATLGIAYL